MSTKSKSYSSSASSVRVYGANRPIKTGVMFGLFEDWTSFLLVLWPLLLLLVLLIIIALPIILYFVVFKKEEDDFNKNLNDENNENDQNNNK